MERRNEVEKAIGEKPYQLLVDAIDDGFIKKKELKKMAMLMDGGVHGVYMAYEDQRDIIDIFERMMDRWYARILFKEGIKALDLLINILEDKNVGQFDLAQKMKQNTKKLFIGLPEKHPDIALFPQGQSTTGTLSGPSMQIGETCASDALGKAALEILDDHGYDADQQKIINELVNAFQQNRKPKNPDEFHMRKIKVDVVKRGDPQIRGEIELEFGIKTQFAVPERNFELKTVPIIAKLGEKVKMVVRWDVFDPKSMDPARQHGHHAIYAKDYDERTGNFSCVNSWGGQDSLPQIHHSRIYAVDYVSLVQTNSV